MVVEGFNLRGTEWFPVQGLHLSWGVQFPRTPLIYIGGKVVSMNKLRPEKQEAVINCLVNGCSIRATERIVGVHRDTIMRLLVRVGNGCERLMDEKMRNLQCKRIQLDEIFGWVGKRAISLTKSDDPNKVGTFWTFVSICADTRLVPTYKIGKRNLKTATEFVADLAGRLENRVQISTDGLKAYVDAIDRVFGTEVDYAQIVKSYEAEPIGEGRYSPPRVVRVKRKPQIGSPDPRHISTSYIERSNLNMRMSMRRMTRLTDAFSRKLENFEAAVALHFAYYNFVRIHRSLRVTPAMEAGVTNRLWSLEDIVKLVEGREQNRP